MRIIVVLFLCSFIYSYADNNARINLNVYNNSKPNLVFNLGFGINELAGDSVDTQLGEKSLPPFPPTFYAVLEYIDSSKYNEDGSKYYDKIWTNLDLRSIPDDKITWNYRYKLVLNWINASSVVLEWNNSNIPNIIDSIFVRDIMGGVVINQDMKIINKLVLDNDAIDKLYFDVYYNKNATNVEDNIVIEDNVIFPNPFSNFINVDNSLNYDFYQVYDLRGNLVSNGGNINNILSFQPGTYFIMFMNKNSIIAKKFITKI